MTRFLLSTLFLTSLTLFQFGCGAEEAPMTPAADTVDPVEELDPAAEAAAEKEANKSQ